MMSENNCAVISVICPYQTPYLWTLSSAYINNTLYPPHPITPIQ